LVAANAVANNAELWTRNRKHYPTAGISFFVGRIIVSRYVPGGTRRFTPAVRRAAIHTAAEYSQLPHFHQTYNSYAEALAPAPPTSMLIW
jgi:hypothetical protein